MIEYPKIQSVYKRDEKTHKFIESAWSLPEFEYLRYNEWEFTEKVDGMNIRVYWSAEHKTINFFGRTDRAQIPIFLEETLCKIFQHGDFERLYPDVSMCLFGEGFGAKIQKGGGNYLADKQGFALFDVLIDNWWLKREDVEDISHKLGLDIVPVVAVGTLMAGIDLLKDGFNSEWGDFPAEGLVAKPTTQLFNRKGERIITKMKHRDF